MAKITQEVLNDFVTTANEVGKNYTVSQWFDKFPEFEKDTSLLQAALDYTETYNTGKCKTLEELNSKFPEFFPKEKGAVQQPGPSSADDMMMYVDAMNPFPQTVKESEMQGKAKAQLERERQSSTNWTNADVMAQKQYQKALAEEMTGGRLPGINVGVDSEGKPAISYGGGDFQFGVPSTQEDAEKMPNVVAAKSKLKSYQTRPNDSGENVAFNVVEAAIANSEYGQQREKAAQDDVSSFEAQRVKEHEDYIKTLQSQINSGKLKYEEAVKMVDKHADMLNAEVEQYATKRQNQLYNEVYEANKDQVSWQLRQYGMRMTDESVKEYLHSIEEGRKNLGKRYFAGEWKNGIHIGPSNEYVRADYYYNTAERLLEQAKEISSAVNENKNFGHGFVEGITDLSTWDFGLSDLATGIDLYKIVSKQERWEKDHNPKDKLTPEEEAVLNAAGTYAMAQAYYADLLGRGYKAGKSSAENVPFMLEFAVMPLEGITNATAKKVLQFAARRAEKKLASKGLDYVKAKGFKKALQQVGARFVGNLKAAGVQTLTFGVPNIASGTLQGKTGQIEGKFGENGLVEYGGITEGSKKSTFTALKDSAISELSSNFSEMIGSTLTPLQVFGRARGIFKGFSKTELGALIAEIQRSQVGRFMRRSQLDCVFFEDLEENVDKLTRWGLVSDYSKDAKGLSDVGFNLDDQIDTFLALAPTSLVFGVAGVTSHYAPIIVDSIKLRSKLNSEAEKNFFDMIMRESRSGDFAARAHTLVRNIVTNKDLTPEGKKLLLEQTFAKYHADLSEKSKKVVDAMAEETYGGFFDRKAQEGMVNTTDHQIHIGHDQQGRQFVISEGHVVTKEVDGENVIDTKSSDKEFTIRYVKKDGTLSDPIKVKNDFAFGAVNSYLPSDERAQMIARGKAELLGDKTFVYDGKTYSTKSGEILTEEQVEEIEQEEREEAREATADELPKGVAPIDTKKRFVMPQTKFSVNLFGQEKPVDIYVTSAGHYMNADGTLDIYDRDGKIDKKKASAFTILDSDKVGAGKKKEEYLIALNNLFRTERVAEIKAAREKEIEEAKANSKEAQDEKLKAQAQTAKQEERKKLPVTKKGEFDYDAATPSQRVFSWVYRTNNVGEEVTNEDQIKEALDTAREDILHVYQQIEKAKKNTSDWPGKIKAEINKLNQTIEDYYSAIQNWIGPSEAEELRKSVNRELGFEQAPTQEQVLAGMVAEVDAMPDEERGKKQVAHGLQQLAEALAMEEDEKNPDKKPCAILNAIQQIRNNTSKMTYELPTVAEGLAAIEADLKEQGYEIAEFVQEGKPYNDGMKVIANFETLEGFGPSTIKRVDQPMVMKDGKMVQVASITVQQYAYETEEEYNAAMLEAEKKKEKDLTGEDIILVENSNKHGEFTFVQVIKGEDGKETYKNLGPARGNTIRSIQEDGSKGGWVRRDKNTRIVYLNAEGTAVPYYDLSSQKASNSILIPMKVKGEIKDNRVTISKTMVYSDETLETPLKGKRNTTTVKDINSIFNRTIFTFADGKNITVGDIFKNFGEDGKMSLLAYVKQRAKNLDSKDANDAVSNLRREMGHAFNDWTNYARENGITYEKLAKDNEALIAFARFLHNLSSSTQPIAIDSRSLAITSAELPSDAVISSNLNIFAAYLSAAQKAGLIQLEEGVSSAIDEYVNNTLMRDGRVPVMQSIDEMRKRYDAIHNGTFEGVEEGQKEVLKKDPVQRARVTKTLREEYPDVLHDQPVSYAPPMSALTPDERSQYRKKVNANVKKTAASANSGKLEFSIRPGETTEQAIQRTGKEQHADLAFQALQLALNSVKGIRLHKVGSQEEARRILAELPGTPEMKFFKVPNGTILGWAIGNEIYLTDEGLNSETAIHEYTHLWVKALRADNPVAWKRIVTMCKKNSALWKKIKNDPNYENIKNNDDAIASELLSRYSGERGAKRLLEEAKQIASESGIPGDKLAESLVKRMQNVLREFWEAVKEKIFHIKSLDNVADMVLKDLFDGKQLNISEEEMAIIKEKAKKEGNFMMSPKGVPTKLTERQWLQVRTTNFKEWYGDWENPKEGQYFLLDEETGEPLVVYHGTERAGFDSFVPKDEVTGENGETILVDNLRAIFTTPQRPIASIYAKGIDEDIEEAQIGDSKEVATKGRYKVIWDAEEGYEPQYFDTWEEAQEFMNYELGFTGYEPDSPDIIDLGAEQQNAVYSLFARMENPLIVDYSDESGNAREWDRYNTGKYLLYGRGVATQTFDSEEEAEAWAKENGLPLEGEDKVFIREEILDTDTWCARAQAQGHDGVIFKNIIDGSNSTALIGTELYKKGHDVVCVFRPNQVKSATQNKGMFSLYDDRIEYSVAEANAEDVAEKREEFFESSDRELINRMAYGSIFKDENLSTIEKIVTRALDTTEGIRRMMNSIDAYRKMVGLPPIDSNHDIRTKFESISSIVHNEKLRVQDGIGKKFTKSWQAVTEKIHKSKFYEDHKEETSPYGSESKELREKVLLTPLQFLERYLMMVDNIENRYKDKKERGLIEFAHRLEGTSMNSELTREQAKAIVEKFVEEFEQAFGSRKAKGNMISDLWASIKTMTDYALDKNLDGRNLSKEKHDELKAKMYYVPQRGNFHKEEELGEEKKNTAQTGEGSSVTIGSLRKAEGSHTLGCATIADIARDAEEASYKGEINKVKILVYELLRDNAAWCAGKFDPPSEVHFEVDSKDEKKEKVVRVKESAEEFRKKTIEQLNEEYNALQKRIDDKDFSTVDEYNRIIEDMRVIDNQLQFSLTNAETVSAYAQTDKDPYTVPLMIDGVLHEIRFNKRYSFVADTLNGKKEPKGDYAFLKTIGGYISAQFTVNNPSFFAVNLIRDVPFVLTKGTSAYGPEFTARFLVNMAAGIGAVGRYATAKNSLWMGKLWDAESDKGTIHMQFKNFLSAGGNTGYSNLESVQKFRAHVRELAPGLSWKDMNDTERAKSVVKGTFKVLDTAIGVLELRPLANCLNEYSELITRFAIYKSIIDMRMGENEAVKAAHNLSVNFNRKGYGHWFVNIFNSLSLFANATIQGASGFFRGFYHENRVNAPSLLRWLTGDDDERKKRKYATGWQKTVQSMAMLSNAIIAPAVLGYIDTLLNPDDDDYQVSDWDRENYAIFGNWRIPLNEQLKPAWAIGVNAALMSKGRRSWSDACNSVGTLALRNWVPLAPNIIDTAANLWDVEKEDNWANEIISMFLPGAMQSIFSVARNENNFGQKLKLGKDGIPEYMAAPQESELFKDVAYGIYVWPGHGRTDLNSEGRRDMGTTYLGAEDNYRPIKERWNVNPKQLRAWSFMVPKGTIDIWSTAWALSKDWIKGNKLGESVRKKDIPIFGAFYREQNIPGYNSRIVKEADKLSKELLGPVNSLVRIALGTATHSELDLMKSEQLRRQGNIEEADALLEKSNREKEKAESIGYEELYPNYNGEDAKMRKELITGKTLDALVRAYKTVDHNRIARTYGLQDIKEFDSDIQISMPETAEELSALANELAINIEYVMCLYKGLQPSRLGDGSFELVPEITKDVYITEKK